MYLSSVPSVEWPAWVDARPSHPPCATGVEDVEDSSEDDDEYGGGRRTSYAREKLCGKRPVEEGLALKKRKTTRSPRNEERPVTISVVAEDHQ